MFVDGCYIFSDGFLSKGKQVGSRGQRLHTPRTRGSRMCRGLTLECPTTNSNRKSECLAGFDVVVASCDGLNSQAGQHVCTYLLRGLSARYPGLKRVASLQHRHHAAGGAAADETVGDPLVHLVRQVVVVVLHVPVEPCITCTMSAERWCLMLASSFIFDLNHRICVCCKTVCFVYRAMYGIASVPLEPRTYPSHPSASVHHSGVDLLL